jgi:hypothetical protein
LQPWALIGREGRQIRCVEDPAGVPHYLPATLLSLLQADPLDLKVIQVIGLHLHPRISQVVQVTRVIRVDQNDLAALTDRIEQIDLKDQIGLKEVIATLQREQQGRREEMTAGTAVSDRIKKGVTSKKQ